MDKIEFERRLSDYVRGELPDAVAREIDDYLAAHPEAVAEVEAVRNMLELSADIGAAEPPVQLLAAARASALKAIRSECEQPRRARFWLWLPRPAWITAVALALAGLVLGVLWRGVSTPAWAQVVENEQTLFGAHGRLVPRGKRREGSGEALVPGPALFPRRWGCRPSSQVILAMTSTYT